MSGDGIFAGVRVVDLTTGMAGPIDDHSSDALLTAAWLRSVGEDAERWTPRGMTKQIARTEGWTFGAR